MWITLNININIQYGSYNNMNSYLIAQSSMIFYKMFVYTIFFKIIGRNFYRSEKL